MWFLVSLVKDTKNHKKIAKTLTTQWKARDKGDDKENTTPDSGYTTADEENDEGGQQKPEP